jgi:ferredoxin
VTDGPGWTVTVDRERCMGTGTCMTYAPGTLVFDAEGKAAVDEPITDDLDSVRAAVESCPTTALAIVGDER